MENKKVELTYILGAGASYQSMPIVDTFPKRFDEFVDYIKSIKSELKSEIGTNNAYQNCIQLPMPWFGSHETTK